MERGSDLNNVNCPVVECCASRGVGLSNLDRRESRSSASGTLIFSIHALTLLSETTGMPNPIPSCNRTLILVICGGKSFEKRAFALVKDLIAMHISVFVRGIDVT